MGIGIFKKIKNGFTKLANKVKNTAKKVVEKLPQVVNVGRQIIDKVKPITGLIPGVGQVVDFVDRGLSYADKAGKVGKSILDKVG